jgi:hypothetical protein
MFSIGSDNRHGLPVSLVLMNVRNFIMARRCRLAASATASGRGSPFYEQPSVKPLCGLTNGLAYDGLDCKLFNDKDSTLDTGIAASPPETLGGD